MDIDTYSPSEEQLKQVDFLGKIVKGCSVKKIDYSIIGGYGLDGLYGSLTRDHDDIDILIKEGEGEVFEKLLAGLGFQHNDSIVDPVKKDFKHCGLNHNFKVSYATSDKLRDLVADSDMAEVVPLKDTAHLLDFSFRAPTIKGNKIIAEALYKRAVKEGWGEYKHRIHSQKILDAL